MRRRRRIQLDLVSGDTAATLLLGILFFLGGVVGCVIAVNIHGEAGMALREYLETYLTLADENAIEVRFWRILWEQLRFPLVVLLLGFTAIGIAGIPVLFVMRGFAFVFSVACFCRLFGWAGLVPAMFLFGLPALLWVPAFFVLGMQAIGCSYTMFRRCMGDGRAPTFFQGAYWVRCALCAGAVALCVAFEYLVLPVLVGASARFVL